MSKPPDDEDPKPLRDAIADALSQLNLGDETTVDRVTEQVKEAFGQLSNLTLDDLTPKERSAPKEDGKPVLRVVRDEFTDELTDEQIAEAALTGRVVTVPLRSTGGSVGGPPLSQEGRIHLPLSANAPWQTIYRGQDFATYRLACTLGEIDIAVDGELVEKLMPGQSVDIEARLIRVRPGSDALATGKYIRC